MNVTPQIDNTWLEALKGDFFAPYFSSLKEFLIEEKKKYVIFPPGKEIFAAYNMTPLDKVKVVIIGQDPYHGRGEANGMCFAVNDQVPLPPSLVNIFKELHDDVGCEIPRSGNLVKWAQQGVLLLNSVLTVRENCAGSHRNKGWENFTNATIKAVSNTRNNVVFILWGNYAKEKRSLIDETKHCVLTAAHPSPLSANRGGFFGCKCFSRTNEYLTNHNITAINWCLNC